MKILIIGLGSIAQKHVEVIKRLKPNAVIYALRSGKGSYAVEGVIDIYDLNDTQGPVDFIIISNPTYLHADTIKECIRFNKPLFIEKPLFDVLYENEEIVEHVLSSGLINYVACNLRFHPIINFLKENIDTHLNEINEVNVYCGSYLPDWRPNQDFRKIYSANADMGGGVHLDLIHELDYCYWLFGMPASTSSIKRNVSTLNISAIDYANYTMEYPHFTTNVVLNYFRRDPKRQIEIVMENTTWTADINTGIIKDSTGKVLFSASCERLYTYDAQMEYFINCLAIGAKTMNTVRDAYDVLQICLA